MFKSIALLAIITFASTTVGVSTTHAYSHFIEPIFAKVGAVVHSVPSAVSHQSFTRVDNKAQVTDVVVPVVRSVQVTPFVKAVPVHHIVKTVEVAPVDKSVEVHAAPVVLHVQYAAAPLVKTAYAATPIIHAAPIVYIRPHMSIL